MGKYPVMIRLEVPSPDRLRTERRGKFTFIEVVPGSVTSSTSSELFELVNEDGRRHLKRIMGAVGGAQVGVDVSPATETLRELLELCRTTLEQHGDAGRRVAEQILPAFQLAPVLDALALRQADAAHDELRALLYTLLSGVTTLAQELSALDATAAVQEMRADHIEDVLATSDEVNLDRFFHWAAAAVEVVDAADALRALEQVQKRAVSEAEGTLHGATFDLRADSPEVSALRTRLLYEDDAFLIAADDALRAGSIPPELAGAVPEVRSCIQEVRAVVTRSQQRLAAAQQRCRTSVLDPEVQARVSALLLQLKRAATQLADYCARPSSAQPWEFSRTADLITRETYERALTTLVDPDSTADALEQRLLGVRRDAHRICEARVDLPRIVAADLARGEQYLADVEAALRGEGVVPPSGTPLVPPQPAPTPPPVATPAPQKPARARSISFRPGQTEVVDARLSVLTGEEPITAGRLEALYELLICAGYALTCMEGKEGFMASSTVPAMLDLLTHCGACTAEEARATSEQLSQRAIADAEEWNHSVRAALSQRWATSGKRWIRYQPGKKKAPTGGRTPPARWRLKLTCAQRAVAIALLAKHGLTTERLSAAQVARNAEKRAQWEATHGAR